MEPYGVVEVAGKLNNFYFNLMKSAYIFHQLNQVYAWAQANMYIPNSYNVRKTDSIRNYFGTVNFVTRDVVRHKCLFPRDSNFLIGNKVQITTCCLERRNLIVYLLFSPI